MADYKYEAQVRAERLAEEEYGKDFYALDSDTQCLLYQKGMDEWRDDQMAAADVMRDRLEES